MDQELSERSSVAYPVQRETGHHDSRPSGDWSRGGSSRSPSGDGSGGSGRSGRSGAAWTRLVFQGSETTVRRWVREWKASQGAEGVPLDPEVAREAEVDWGTDGRTACGESSSSVRGQAHSSEPTRGSGRRCSSMATSRVLRRCPELVYDNLSLSVRRILIEQERFVSFRSYYTYRARFCTPGQGREKGGVEGHIGYARRNFLVPVPEVADFQGSTCTNAVRRRPAADRDAQQHRRTLRGGARAAARPCQRLPLSTKVVRVDHYQTVNVDRNRYSVPGAYVGRWLWAQRSNSTPGPHERIFQVADRPQALLGSDRTTGGGLRECPPILQWRARWPRSYEVLLQTLRRGENTGTREFVRILKLHRAHESPVVERAPGEGARAPLSRLRSIRHLIGLESSPLRFVEPLAADRTVTDQAVSRTRVEVLLTEAPAA